MKSTPSFHLPLLIAAVWSIFWVPSAFATPDQLIERWDMRVSGGGAKFVMSDAVAMGPDGHTVVAGTSCNIADDLNCDIRTIKYDAATGVILWDVTFNSGGANMDAARGVAIGGDGHPLVVGSSCDPNGGACVLRVLKYHGATGVALWNVTHGISDDFGAFFELAFGTRPVAIGPDGHLVVTGSFCHGDYTDCALRTIKIDGMTGSILWTAMFVTQPDLVHPGYVLDLGYGVAVGADGHPVVTGQSCNADYTDCVRRTIKYEGASGSILWNVTFDSGFEAGSDESDRGIGVSIGADGHPVVVGYSQLVLRVMKHDGATGAIMWNALLDTGQIFESVPDQPERHRIAVGADGHAVVSGFVCVAEDDCEGRAMQLDGSTGVVRWTRTLPQFDRLDSVAIGADGNLVFAGTSCDVDTAYTACDFRTIAYLVQQATPAGTTVAVSLNGGSSVANGVSVTYASVTAAGDTTLVTSATGPTPPSGFGFIGAPPTYYDLATTATASGPVEVCVNYGTQPFAEPEDGLRLFHFEAGSWVDVTTSLDLVANVICGSTTSFSPFAIAQVSDGLAALGPASVWLGLKNSDDVGIRFDVRVQVYRNGNELVASGQVDSVAGGSSGFNNAKLRTIDLTPASGIAFPSGSTFTIGLFVRNACSGSGKNSGSARLWYGNSAANSRVVATLGSLATHYLLNGFVLGTSPGTGPMKFVDVAAGTKCSAFKSSGAWTMTIP